MRHLGTMIVLGLIGLVSAAARAGDFAGSYKGPNLSAEIKANNDGQYSGIIHLGPRDFPMTGRADGDRLIGTFNSEGRDFPITANLTGDVLTLATGHSTYVLNRQDVRPANPLDAAPADNPLAQDRPTRQAAPYTVLATNDSGKALFFQKPESKSAAAALEATLPDLANAIGAKPIITGAFADKAEQSRGGALFTASVVGKALRGIILCGGGEKGEAVTAIYARTDAPPRDWAILCAALPVQDKMERHDFADGTGSIEYPADWNTDAQSVLGGFTVSGPAHQKVNIGKGFEVVTPNSMMAQMHAQMLAQSRMYGQPASPMLIAPFTGPVEALQNLIPQLDAISRQSGGPGIRLDRIITKEQAQSVLPNGRAALIYFACTKTACPDSGPYRSMAQVECYPLTQQGWGMMFTELAAPDANFDQSLPTMWAIARSFKTNDAAIQQRTQQTIQQNNQRFASFEQSMKEKNQAFDHYMDSVRNQQLVRSRSNDDFDEVIRGYRTVQDTRTGERGTADLGNVNEIVDKMNESDPGRYVQIPLRDESDPLPGR